MSRIATTRCLKMSKNKNKNEEIEQDEIPEVVGEEIEDKTTELLNKLADLKKKSEEEAKRADDMTAVATRLRADFDNYRKRTNESVAKEREAGRVEVLEKIIPMLDVVDQAIGMIGDQSVKSGVEMIKQQLEALLKAFGVQEVDTECEFDPKIHEAIMRMPCEKPEQAGTIHSVFQKGYTIGGRLIRPARVVVYNN